MNPICHKSLGFYLCPIFLLPFYNHIENASESVPVAFCGESKDFFFFFYSQICELF